MASEERDVEEFLTVGCPAVFHSDPFNREAPRHPTVVRGWRKPSYILIDRPRMAGRYAAIRENQSCVIRFVHEGRACAFTSIVLDWDNRSLNAYTRIEWPKTCQVMAFRKTERLKLHLPCRVRFDGGERTGWIEDLSLGGCRLRLTEPVEAGGRVALSFSLPDGAAVDEVECVIRNVQSADDGARAGCQFCPDQASVESDIAFFITTQLERTGIRETAPEQILLIDGISAQAAELRRHFQGRGYEALIAAETLDGLSRLRVTVPEALLINCAQEELSAPMTLRLVKASRGLGALPTFLYNGDGPETEVQAARFGAAGYFQAGTPPDQIAKAVVLHLRSAQTRDVQG